MAAATVSVSVSRHPLVFFGGFLEFRVLIFSYCFFVEFFTVPVYSCLVKSVFHSKIP